MFAIQYWLNRQKRFNIQKLPDTAKLKTPAIKIYRVQQCMPTFSGYVSIVLIGILMKSLKAMIQMIQLQGQSQHCKN